MHSRQSWGSSNSTPTCFRLGRPSCSDEKSRFFIESPRNSDTRERIFGLDHTYTRCMYRGVSGVVGVVHFFPCFVFSVSCRKRIRSWENSRVTLFFFLFFDHHFYFPAQLVGFLPSAIFWTSPGHRCRPFSPPGTCL